MARSCAHSFQMIKSDNTLVQFSCYVCQAGPSWFIFEWSSSLDELELFRPAWS
ncbi:hypothetical protein F4775DRAFT_592582 [Biscogniauxia sp. FL1348]|nr:hypothetical protein F4775DRAFT_592582 [Biscogniauxia sp. FL1348]